MEDKKIEMTLLGKKRLVSLQDLIKIYEELGDPNPKENAIKNYDAHIIESLKTPEEILNYIKIAFENDYDPNFDIFGGSVKDIIFELAEKLPYDMLEKFTSKFHDDLYAPKFKEILNRKRIFETKQDSETILKYLETEFTNDYDFNFDTFGGNVGDQVFELAEQLPYDMLEKFASRFHDDLYAPKFKEILTRKRQNETPQVPDEHEEP